MRVLLAAACVFCVVDAAGGKTKKLRPSGAVSSRGRAAAALAPLTTTKKVITDKAIVGGASSGNVDTLKLLIGAGGIYSAFLYYGSLQEDVFRYVSSDGKKFTEVWFLQVLEAAFNVFVGGIGLALTPGSRKLPQKLFACTGATQVLAKYCTNAALASGVSFPVTTLAKSGKMVPVMAGSLLLGGASYSLRQYLSVAAIVAGTALVSLSGGKKKGVVASSGVGFAFIVASLVFDGVTGGVQKRVKMETKRMGVKPEAYDYMFFTNVYMLATAAVAAIARGEMQRGVQFCLENPLVLRAILKFAACSAFGQTFIFFTIANFDPLVCTTVTTTRKIFSVLLSIVLKGHSLNSKGWAGVAVASLGILSEVAGKKH